MRPTKKYVRSKTPSFKNVRRRFEKAEEKW